jgi:ASPIC/UnbV protein/VCBS repeat protein
VSTSSKKLCLVILVALVSIGAALFLIRTRRESSPPAESANLNSRISGELAGEVVRLEAREQQMNETVWAKELLAQDCGRTFETLWDSVNAATNKLGVLAQFQLGEILVPEWKQSRSLGHGIELLKPAGPGGAVGNTSWKDFVAQFQSKGWQLEQIEFRHNQFETESSGGPSQSRFYFSAHLVNTNIPERAAIEGDLLVDWGTKENDELLTPIKRIDATHLTAKTRKGDPPFKSILHEEIVPSETSRLIDPLIVYDLDRDGFLEIILVAKDLVYRRQSDGTYRPEQLCRFPTPYIWTALLADFDGDGFVDLLCDKYEGLYLFKGSSQGRFDQPAKLVGKPATQNAMVMTCGDIDADGDLDVFLAQYEEPYANGTTPNPFYDANDGNPSYLLFNDGRGNFNDATIGSGLEKKRWRRSYSASFADLDDDGDLDLMVVSDFSGLDLYQNDGKGRFADVTATWVADPHAFGMAHALADFNHDSRLDLLMIGMTSPAVNRLEHLGLWRPDAQEDRSMRSRMTFGNRLYLATGKTQRFEQNTLGDSIAHSGWSWGCGAADFDNDGFPDVYIANGLESNQSVRDYEAEYWLHDRYIASGTNRSAAGLYFKTKFARTRSREYSYGGYEKNRLYLNQGGRSFLEAGYLFGVAIEADCRNVIAEDLDADGRVDLLVTTLEVWPKRKQTLRVFKNLLVDSNNNWIAWRFPEQAGGKSPVGATIKIHYAGREAIHQIITGDSYRSQRSNSVHFGLGTVERIETAEINWADGRAESIENTVINVSSEVKVPRDKSPGH